MGEDYKAIYQMAELMGGGFANLPPDRQTLVAKLDKSGIGATGLAGVGIHTLGGRTSPTPLRWAASGYEHDLGPHYVRVAMSLCWSRDQVNSNPVPGNLKSSGLLSDEQVAEVSDAFPIAPRKSWPTTWSPLASSRNFKLRSSRPASRRGSASGRSRFREIGRGGYGCVYKARQKLMNRIIALKVIAPERVEDSCACAWFRREVLAATQSLIPTSASPTMPTRSMAFSSSPWNLSTASTWKR